MMTQNMTNWNPDFIQVLYFLQSTSQAYAGGLIYQTALPFAAESPCEWDRHPVAYGVT